MDTNQLRKIANQLSLRSVQDDVPEPMAEYGAMMHEAADIIDKLRAQLREAHGSYRPLDMNWPT
jgi:hypothetical protein